MFAESGLIARRHARAAGSSPACRAALVQSAACNSTARTTSDERRGREDEGAQMWFRNSGEEVAAIRIAEPCEVLDDLAQRRVRIHPTHTPIVAAQVSQCPSQRSVLCVESKIDQRVVVEIDPPVVVEVAVAPAGQLSVVAVVDAA